MKSENTFVLLKPEAVQRKLVGRILTRFEDAGLTIKAIKLVHASEELVQEHYPSDNEWLKTVGGKTLDAYKEYNIDPLKELGMDDALEIGKLVKGWLVKYISSGPVIAITLTGNHAVDAVRKLIGNTIPLFANPGTMRGDFSLDSPDSANPEKRPIYNLIHASGTAEEAKHEISLWFRNDENL